MTTMSEKTWREKAMDAIVSVGERVALGHGSDGERYGTVAGAVLVGGKLFALVELDECDQFWSADRRTFVSIIVAHMDGCLPLFKDAVNPRAEGRGRC